MSGIVRTERSHVRNWVKKFFDDPHHAFPGNGQMKPEQLEIAGLKHDVAKVKAEWDIEKRRSLLAKFREI